MIEMSNFDNEVVNPAQLISCYKLLTEESQRGSSIRKFSKLKNMKVSAKRCITALGYTHQFSSIWMQKPCVYISACSPVHTHTHTESLTNDEPGDKLTQPHDLVWEQFKHVTDRWVGEGGRDRLEGGGGREGQPASPPPFLPPSAHTHTQRDTLIFTQLQANTLEIHSAWKRWADSSESKLSKHFSRSAQASIYLSLPWN